MPDQRTAVAGVRGINLRDNPRQLPDGECVMTRNLVPTRYNNQLVKRDELVNYGPLSYLNISEPNPPALAQSTIMLGSAPGYGTVAHSGFLGVYSFTDSAGKQWLSTVPQDITLQGFAVQASGVGHNLCPAVFAQFNQYMLAFPGKEAGLRFSAPFDGSQVANPTQFPFLYATVTGTTPNFTFAPFNGASNTGVLPAGGTKYLSRMLYWNLATGYEDCILFSDNALPWTIGDNVLASNGRYVEVGSLAEGPIVCCVPIMLSTVATPAQQACLVLKENAAYLITGEPNQTTDTITTTAPEIGTLQIARVNVQTTCVSHASVVRTPNGVIWCGKDDVWAFEGGTVPRKIGGKITNLLLERISLMGTETPFVHGVYDGQFYRLALPASQDENNPFRKFGEMQDQFRLSLINGVPQSSDDALWFGPHQFLVSKALEANPAPSYFTSFQNPLTPIQTATGASVVSLYPVTQNYWDGAGMRTAICQFFEMGGQQQVGIGMDRTSYSPGIPPGGQTASPAWADVGTSIIGEIRTGYIDDGDIGTDSLYTGTEVGFRMNPAYIKTADPRVQLSTPLNLAVELNGYGTASYASAANTNAQIYLDTAFFIDGTQLDQHAFRSGYIAKLVYPDCSTRPVGKTIQLQFKDVSAYVTNSNHSQFIIEYNTPGNFITVPLTAGYYTTFQSYLDFLVAQLTAAIPGTAFSHNYTPYGTFVAGNFTITENNGNSWRPSTSDALTLNVLKLIYFDSSGFSLATSQRSTVFVSNIVPNFSTRWGLESLILRHIPIPRMTDGT